MNSAGRGIAPIWIMRRGGGDDEDGTLGITITELIKSGEIYGFDRNAFKRQSPPDYTESSAEIYDQL